jgi:hypothetical protein
MIRFFALAGLLLSVWTVEGQTNPGFEKFLGKFPVLDSFPVFITYSNDEQAFFGAIAELDSIEVSVRDTVVVEYWYEYREPSDDFERVLLDEDDIYSFLRDAIDMTTFDYEDDYIAVGQIPLSNSFHTLVYDRIYFLYGYKGSVKHLATFTPEGGLISCIQVATLTYGGTGSGLYGNRVPWFPMDNSQVDANGSLCIIPDQDIQRCYQIESNGHIREVQK